MGEPTTLAARARSTSCCSPVPSAGLKRRAGQRHPRRRLPRPRRHPAQLTGSAAGVCGGRRWWYGARRWSGERRCGPPRRSPHPARRDWPRGWGPGAGGAPGAAATPPRPRGYDEDAHRSNHAGPATRGAARLAPAAGPPARGRAAGRRAVRPPAMFFSHRGWLPAPAGRGPACQPGRVSRRGRGSRPTSSGTPCRPAPSGGGWHGRCAPASRPSPAPASSACSPARPRPADRRTGRPRRGSPG
jgi:hypothetical protein